MYALEAAAAVPLHHFLRHNVIHIIGRLSLSAARCPAT